MFNPGYTATLLEDIISYGNVTKLPNKGVYGKKGDKVTIIAYYGEVAIVELNKNRFAVTKEKLKI